MGHLGKLFVFLVVIFAVAFNQLKDPRLGNPARVLLYSSKISSYFANPFSQRDTESIRREANKLEDIIVSGSISFEALPVQTRFLEFKTSDGGSVSLRVHIPKSSSPSSSLLPVLIYYHGGGFTIMSSRSHEPFTKQLSVSINCIVVSVDYRLAPEHKFPTAVNDAYETAVWVSQHATEFGGDPTKIAVAGDSAGGNLAAVVSHIAKSKDNTPKISLQFLIYPVVLAHSNTPSYLEFENKDYLLNGPMMDFFLDCYLNDVAVESKDPRMSPLLYEDFKGLPPAITITAELDPLRDEGEYYSEKLKKAGVDSEYYRINSTIHGFVTLPWMPETKFTIQKAIESLNKAWNR